MIVRIAEYDGKDQKGILTAGKNDYPIVISPYEIKTLKLTPDQCMDGEYAGAKGIKIHIFRSDCIPFSVIEDGKHDH